MNGIFRIDGPFYKFGNIIFYLLVTNILWVIFSLPFFTIGASTTALFYVIGKVVRDEDPSVFKDYWKSFKMNFKQATILWIILVVLFMIIFTNIRNIGVFGSMAKFILPVQFAILFELIIVTIYVFPLLSRYEMKIKNLFKTALFLGNRHILTTILCVASIVAIYFFFFKIPGLIIMMFASLYALSAYYMIQNIFRKYVPEENKREEIDEEEEA